MLRKAATIAKIVVAVVMFGTLAVVLLFFTDDDTAADAAVGDCVKVVSKTADAELKKVGCGSDDGIYRVAKRLDEDTDPCPAGDYAEYTRSGNGDFKLCLALNTREGDCFTDHLDDTVRTDCTGRGGGLSSFKITAVVDGVADAQRCGADAPNALTHGEPPATVCRVPVG